MTDKKTQESLQIAIKQGMAKIGAKKDSELCRFIPMEVGGYIHHFTFKKLKTEDPKMLTSWINKYVVDVSKPQTVPPKARAARGSRKRSHLNFSRNDLEKILQMARVTGNEEMVRKLTARWDLKGIQRRLINSIREKQVDAELWNTYADVVSNFQSAEEQLTQASN